jgi:hypothetical protein
MGVLDVQPMRRMFGNSGQIVAGSSIRPGLLFKDPEGNRRTWLTLDKLEVQSEHLTPGIASLKCTRGKDQSTSPKEQTDSLSMNQQLNHSITKSINQLINQ